MVLAVLVLVWVLQVRLKLMGNCETKDGSFKSSRAAENQRTEKLKANDNSNDGATIGHVCHKCLETTLPNGKVCSKLIHHRMQSKGALPKATSKLLNVMLETAKAVCPGPCFDDCSDNERRYWRHDAAAPAEVTSQSHLLTSIPEQYRLPRAAIQDLTKFFNEFKEDARFPARIYLFAYNPSMVRLPETVARATGATYASSYRVTAFQYCFRHKYSKYVFNIKDSYPSDAPPLQGLVAIALLRDDLSIIHEMVVDVSSIFPKFEDARLFLLQGQLYMSSFEYIVPFWLSTDGGEVVLRDYWNPGKNDFVLSFQKEVSCCRAPTCKGGKNFNYFEALGKTYVETNPMSPRIVEQVNLQEPCSQVSTTEPTVYESNDALPPATFQAVDTVLFAAAGYLPTRKSPISQERGTACCISIPNGRGGTWLVGISHSKSRRVEELARVVTGRQYFSRWYAFESVAPFQLQAVSGRFCLGFPSNADEKENYFNVVARQQHFRMGDELECPKISFATGLTDMGDGKVAISYGINDCTGRMMVVNKSGIAKMLIEPM